MQNLARRTGKEMATTSESDKKGKTCQDMLGGKDKKKTADKFEDLTWKDKSNDIG